jgi:hypothetical protein
MNAKKALLLQRERTLRDLPPLTEVVRGSLVERYLRCGKPSCRCLKGPGHQAYYLTVSFARGRTEQVTVPKALVPVVERWLANYDRWWRAIEEISGTNRELLRRRWLEPDDLER